MDEHYVIFPLPDEISATVFIVTKEFTVTAYNQPFKNNQFIPWLKIIAYLWYRLLPLWDTNIKNIILSFYLNSFPCSSKFIYHNFDFFSQFWVYILQFWCNIWQIWHTHKHTNFWHTQISHTHTHTHTHINSARIYIYILSRTSDFSQNFEKQIWIMALSCNSIITWWKQASTHIITWCKTFPNTILKTLHERRITVPKITPRKTFINYWNNEFDVHELTMKQLKWDALFNKKT